MSTIDSFVSLLRILIETSGTKLMSQMQMKSSTRASSGYSRCVMNMIWPVGLAVVCPRYAALCTADRGRRGSRISVPWDHRWPIKPMLPAQCAEEDKTNDLTSLLSLSLSPQTFPEFHFTPVSDFIIISLCVFISSWVTQTKSSETERLWRLWMVIVRFCLFCWAHCALMCQR